MSFTRCFDNQRFIHERATMVYTQCSPTDFVKEQFFLPPPPTSWIWIKKNRGKGNVKIAGMVQIRLYSFTFKRAGVLKVVVLLQNCSDFLRYCYAGFRPPTLRFLRTRTTAFTIVISKYKYFTILISPFLILGV